MRNNMDLLIEERDRKVGLIKYWQQQLEEGGVALKHCHYSAIYATKVREYYKIQNEMRQISEELKRDGLLPEVRAYKNAKFNDLFRQLEEARVDRNKAKKEAQKMEMMPEIIEGMGKRVDEIDEMLRNQIPANNIPAPMAPQSSPEQIRAGVLQDVENKWDRETADRTAPAYDYVVPNQDAIAQQFRDNDAYQPPVNDAGFTNVVGNDNPLHQVTAVEDANEKLIKIGDAFLRRGDGFAITALTSIAVLALGGGMAVAAPVFVTMGAAFLLRAEVRKQIDMRKERAAQGR